MTPEPVKLATRGSRLAMAQAEAIKSELEAHRRTVELVEVTTTGDTIDDTLIHELGTVGAFVRSLDQQVLDGEVDGAIHSLKDVPTQQPDELVIAAVPRRGPREDVLVTPCGATLDDLQPGAIVGTGSLRRQAQLRRLRDDITIEPIRGNIDTRLTKLYASALKRDIDPIAPVELEERAHEREVETEYDAIVIARVGLERAGLLDDVAWEPIPELVPAPGQGAIALTTLDTDLAGWINHVLDDPRSRVETTVERVILSTLGGGCVAPIGASALIQGEFVRTTVQVLDREGEEVIEATRKLPVEDHVEAARTFAAELVSRGAAALIEQAKRETPGPQHRDQ